MRILPFAVRDSEDAAIDAEIEVGLVVLRHPDDPQPWRIASDNKHRVTSFPVPHYATFSRWLVEGVDPAPAQFDFVRMALGVPEPGEEARTQIVIPNAAAELLARISGEARRLVTADFAIVNASSPDIVLYERLGMQVVGATFDPRSIAFEIEPEPILEEYYPRDSISEATMPGLYA